MTQKIGRKKTMEERTVSLKLDDVYDIAGKVSNEFSVLISKYGDESLEKLIKLIMVTLQHLENNIISREHQDNKMSDLKMHIAQLESYKDGKLECQQKFEKDLEQIEEQWRWEKSQLADEVKQLKEENRKLRQAVSTANDAPSICEYCATHADTNSMVQSMKNTVERLQHQLAEREQEQRNTTDALESTQAQLNSLLKDQVRHLQKQVQTLVEEKSFLQVQLASTMALDKWMPAAAAADSPHQEGDTEDHEAYVPVAEVKKLMWEREDLLCQVRDLKDELASFQSAPSDPNISLSSEVLSCSLSSSLSNASSSVDLPVEGPINREPYEKLFPGRKMTRIQKFFSFLLGKDPYLPTPDAI